MSWRFETGDGRAAWSGEDSVFDPCFRERTIQWWFKSGAAFLGLAMIGEYGIKLPVTLALEAMGIQGLTLSLVLIALTFILFVPVIILAYPAFERRLPKPERFYCRTWRLEAEGGALRYRAEEFDGPLAAHEVSPQGRTWSVALDDVSRVETGLTTDWQGVRLYKGAPKRFRGRAQIPPREYQTYLFLADGSRRVVFTVNAERESSATLAHSIRSWLEARRSAPGIPAPEAGGEGFDP